MMVVWRREKREGGGDLQPNGSGGLYLHISSIGGITHCVSLPLAPHPRPLPPITIPQRALTGQYIHTGLIDESISVSPSSSSSSIGHLPPTRRHPIPIPFPFPFHSLSRPSLCALGLGRTLFCCPFLLGLVLSRDSPSNSLPSSPALHPLSSVWLSLCIFFFSHTTPHSLTVFLPLQYYIPPLPPNDATPQLGKTHILSRLSTTPPGPGQTLLTTMLSAAQL